MSLGENKDIKNKYTGVVDLYLLFHLLHCHSPALWEALWISNVLNLLRTIHITLRKPSLNARGQWPLWLGKFGEPRNYNFWSLFTMSLSLQFCHKFSLCVIFFLSYWSTTPCIQVFFSHEGHLPPRRYHVVERRGLNIWGRRAGWAEAPGHNWSRKLMFGSLIQEALSDFQAELEVSALYLSSTSHMSIILHIPFWHCWCAHLATPRGKDCFVMVLPETTTKLGKDCELSISVQ